VNDSSIVMKSSLARAVANISLGMLIFGALTAIGTYYRHGHWPTLFDVEGFMLAMVLMATVVCLAFRPRSIAYDEEGVQIENIFGRTRTLRWLDLYSYGNGNNVFFLKFEDASNIQILPGGFKRTEWKAFIEFLNREYPDERAHFWGAPRGR
jgi:hypothetical protein